MQSEDWKTVRRLPATRRGFGRGLVDGCGRFCATSLFALVVVGSALAASSSNAPEFSAAEVYQSSASSVVLIFGFGESGPGSPGTGSILTADGLVLTNNHVITDSKTGRLFPSLVVYLKPVSISGDNRKDLTTPLLVDVVARDSGLDLALLRIKDAPDDLRPIAIADSEEIEIGESVAAIGHPGGGGLWTLTTGTISSKRRDRSRDIFQTDTAINPGNSGGPLLDGNARMVGVNTFVRRVDEHGLPLEGLNYSLRSAFALRWVNQQGVARIGVVPRSQIAKLNTDGMRPTAADSATSATSDEATVNPAATSTLTLGLRPQSETNASVQRGGWRSDVRGSESDDGSARVPARGAQGLRSIDAPSG
jgi:S1-C subfamily serine protease